MFVHRAYGSRRAATLLEVLCAGTLSLLSLSVVAQVLLPAFKSSGQVASRMEMQQQVSVVLLRLTRELQKTRPESLSYWEGKLGNILCLHQVEGVALGDPPVPIYSRQLVFYWFSSASGSLTRSPWPVDIGHPLRLDPTLLPPDGSSAVQPTSTQLRTILRNAPSGQRLATSVRGFRVTSGGTELTSPLSIHLELERQLPGKAQPITFKLTQVVSVRSQE